MKVPKFDCQLSAKTFLHDNNGSWWRSYGDNGHEKIRSRSYQEKGQAFVSCLVHLNMHI